MGGHWHDDEFDPWCDCDRPDRLACGNRYDNMFETWTCSQRPGHADEHGDEFGNWWPTDDQLATW